MKTRRERSLPPRLCLCAQQWLSRISSSPSFRIDGAHCGGLLFPDREFLGGSRRSDACCSLESLSAMSSCSICCMTTFLRLGSSSKRISRERFQKSRSHPQRRVQFSQICDHRQRRDPAG